MEIDRVRFKNLLSFGNGWTEFTFSNGQIMLLVGENGSGKSALYEAIFVGLFGKPFRKVKKDGVVNMTNARELLIEIEFRQDGKSYKVVRGQRPNVFEIWEDGVLKNQDAASRDYQDYLERFILRMRERTFRQVVILGSRSFVPFMQLSPGERRIVVEDLLLLTVYGEMLELSKRKVTEITKTRDDAQRKLDIAQNTITMLSREHARAAETTVPVQESVEDHLREKVAQLRADGIGKAQSLKEIDEPALRKDLSTQVVQREGLFRKKSMLDGEVNSTVKQAGFFKNHETCPTCSQSMSQEMRDGHFKACLESIDAKRKEIRDIEAAIQVIDEAVGKINAELDRAGKLHSELGNLMIQIREAEGTLKKASSSKEMADTIRAENLRRIQAEMDAALDASLRLQAEIAAQNQDLVEYTKLTALCRDDGIKKKVVADYLPQINGLVKKYLEVLDFSVQFTFDEQFDETIRSRFRDEFAYGNFSEGQKLRLDLVLLFTWRELARRQRGGAWCNLLILDEIGDSSLDAAGFEAFCRILLANRDQQSVVIISHKPQGIVSKADKVVTVGFRNGFSEILSYEDTGQETMLT